MERRVARRVTSASQQAMQVRGGGMWTLMAVALAQADVRDAVVVVQQGASTCAGTLIDDAGTVITAYHCVGSGWRARVEARDGTRGVGRVIAERPSLDVAVLSVPALAGKPGLSLAEASPEVGAAVWAIGHPWAARAPMGFMAGTLRWSQTEGTISAVGERALQTSASLNPGNSGGPLVDADGRLVGVVSRKLGEGIGFATRVEQVREVIAKGRRPSLAGGSISFFATGTAWRSVGGVAGLGLGLELALRQRLLFDVEAVIPVADRWTLVDRGLVVSPVALGSLGWRQPFGHGPFTTHLDLWGGAAVVERRTAEGLERPEFRYRVAPGFGGRLGLAGFDVEVGAFYDDAAWTVRVGVRLGSGGAIVF